MSNTPVSGDSVRIVTGDNLDTYAYTPRRGQTYEIAPGCVRTLNKPTYGLNRLYSELMDKENIAEIDIKSEAYSDNVRLDVIAHITSGDPIPKKRDDIDMEVVGRIVADFFTYRIAKPAVQSPLLASTNSRTET